MLKALITTVPFADKDRLPLDRKLTENELAEMVTDYDVIIAGTEPITNKVMSAASNLKLISRVGVGLDSINLLAARERGIKVSYTPDSPAPAVAELTLGLAVSFVALDSYLKQRDA